MLIICRLIHVSWLLTAFTLRSASSPTRTEPNGNPRWCLKGYRHSTCPPYVRTAAALHEACTSFRLLSCVGIHGGLPTCSGWHTPHSIGSVTNCMVTCCLFYHFRTVAITTISSLHKFHTSSSSSSSSCHHSYNHHNHHNHKHQQQINNKGNTVYAICLIPCIMSFIGHVKKVKLSHNRPRWPKVFRVG